jgi:hypothetical protein
MVPLMNPPGATLLDASRIWEPYVEAVLARQKQARDGPRPVTTSEPKTGVKHAEVITARLVKDERGWGPMPLVTRAIYQCVDREDRAGTACPCSGSLAFALALGSLALGCLGSTSRVDNHPDEMSPLPCRVS